VRVYLRTARIAPGELSRPALGCTGDEELEDRQNR
jgi:hypothetical protein